MSHLWPESTPRRWIHGIGGLIVGGTLALFLAIMAYGLFVQGNSIGISTFAALTVAVITSGFVAVPYALGSLAARVARRPYWIVGACGVVGLTSIGFRLYFYGIGGEGQAFLNMILHVAPYSALVFTGWAVSLWHSAYVAEVPSPPVVLIAAVSGAALLGAGGSVVGWLLRDSPLWFKVGGPMFLASLGLGLWALRRAEKTRGH